MKGLCSAKKPSESSLHIHKSLVENDLLCGRRKEGREGGKRKKEKKRERKEGRKTHKEDQNQFSLCFVRPSLLPNFSTVYMTLLLENLGKSLLDPFS
jgi:hypothetical protein